MRSCFQTRQRNCAVTTTMMNLQHNRLFSSVEQVEEDRGTASSASSTATKMAVPFTGSKEEIIKEEQKRKRLAEVSTMHYLAHSHSYSHVRILLHMEYLIQVYQQRFYLYIPFNATANDNDNDN